VRRLADRFPGCQTFSIDGLVGASPEVLVARTGAELRSLVLAGTAPRGEDAATDGDHAQRLLASDKERREHRFAVESVRDALMEAAGDLKVGSSPEVLRLANVMHLATTVTANAVGSASSLALAGLLHPSAAVCGTPTSAAQEMIRRLEGMDRARYSGPVGWTDARGDGQWAIALRCAELRGTRARLFAGAGIVDGSLPEAELEETRLKLRAMQSAFAG
jgi:menaquinone-specific isochorismate synthase